jgi:hypothetical protein
MARLLTAQHFLHLKVAATMYESHGGIEHSDNDSLPTDPVEWLL